MKNILIFLIFTIVLFFYLHITYHHKKSNDLEIYESNINSKNELEEICNYRQPVLFSYNNTDITDNINRDKLLLNYSLFELNVRSIDVDHMDNIEMYIPYKLSDLFKAFKNDKDKKYITEKNSDFLNESGLIKYLKNNDIIFRPYFMLSCEYDIMSGSIGTRTPLRYNLYNRNFFHIIEGSVTINLCPPNTNKYVNEQKDYDNYEFRTDINIWDRDDKNKHILDKIKILSVKLVKNQIIYIPSYWWYSIEYENQSTIVNYSYQTYMSTLSIMPNIFLHFLQQQNIKINKFKKYNFKYNNDES